MPTASARVARIRIAEGGEELLGDLDEELLRHRRVSEEGDSEIECVRPVFRDLADSRAGVRRTVLGTVMRSRRTR